MNFTSFTLDELSIQLALIFVPAHNSLALILRIEMVIPNFLSSLDRLGGSLKKTLRMILSKESLSESTFVSLV